MTKWDPPPFLICIFKNNFLEEYFGSSHLLYLFIWEHIEKQLPNLKDQIWNNSSDNNSEIKKTVTGKCNPPLKFSSSHHLLPFYYIPLGTPCLATHPLGRPAGNLTGRTESFAECLHHKVLGDTKLSLHVTLWRRRKTNQVKNTDTEPNTGALHWHKACA